MQRLLDTLGEVDILVNNVGLFAQKSFGDIADDEWQRYFDVNVMSGVRLSRHVLNGMLTRGEGRILFIGSESGVNIPADMVPYGVTKAAMLALSNGLAKLMQDKLDIETLVHVCGRDRNLLGQVAHLLGAHALGIRNLVVITGDPPKIGDFPDATAVYDLDSVGILRLVSRLNAGIDPGGKPLGGITSFFCATGAEPAALTSSKSGLRLTIEIAPPVVFLP